jgi:hypothetical protein
MKTVYSNGNAIGHLWAHQTQGHARAGNVSFSGSAFVSYETVIARIVSGPTGERAYLLTLHSYSNSTSKHQNIARRAIPNDAPIFYVPVTCHGFNRWPEVSKDHELNVSLFADEINSKLSDANESREPKKSRLILEAASVLDKANKYQSYFGLSFELPNLPYTAAQLRAMAEKQESDYRKRSDAARERNKALRAIPWNQRIAMQRERNAEKLQKQINAWSEKLQKQINAWLNGGASFQAYGIDTMLRIKGDNVETSRDASFPVSHAKRGLALVEAVIASKEEWKRNGKTAV